MGTDVVYFGFDFAFRVGLGEDGFANIFSSCCLEIFYSCLFIYE